MCRRRLTCRTFRGSHSPHSRRHRSSPTTCPTSLRRVRSRRSSRACSRSRPARGSRRRRWRQSWGEPGERSRLEWSCRTTLTTRTESITLTWPRGGQRPLANRVVGTWQDSWRPCSLCDVLTSLFVAHFIAIVDGPMTLVGTGLSPQLSGCLRPHEGHSRVRRTGLGARRLRTRMASCSKRLAERWKNLPATFRCCRAVQTG